MGEKNILEEAKDLYDDEKWQQSIDLLESNIDILIAEARQEAFRRFGWNYYHLGIKAITETRKQELLKKAVDNWYRCTGTEVRLSAMNGLPLALYILGEKEKAFSVNDMARQDYPDEPSVDNTRVILYRWNGQSKQLAEAAQRVYEKGRAKGDFRTAGHGKHNQGDTLMELGG